MSPSDPHWTREESKHADGEADRETRRHVEARWADEPARAERRRAWRLVTSLWREDAARRAPAIDPDRLAATVLGRTSAARGDDRVKVAARRYAAAALVLIGLGTLGATWIGPRRDRSPADGTRLTLVQLEMQRLDLQRVREWERFRPALPGEER